MVSGVLFLSRRLEGGCGRIGPGQELVETALGMAVDDAADHVSQVGPGFDPDQLAGLNQRCNHRPVRGSAVRARKESIFPGEGNLLVSWSFCPYRAGSRGPLSLASPLRASRWPPPQ